MLLLISRLIYTREEFVRQVAISLNLFLGATVPKKLDRFQRETNLNLLIKQSNFSEHFPERSLV